MFARALFVLLLVLNIGVATWWAVRPPPSPPASKAAPPGVAQLQLVQDARAPTPTVAPAAATVTPEAAVPSPTPADAVGTGALQCFSFGPFSNDQLAVAAQARLQPLTKRIVVRAQRRGTSRGWRVMLPSLPDAAQAAATAERIAAAGFNDYFVVREGTDANSIALGRYGNEATARRRAEALVAAGFAARAEPLGGTITWLDISVAPGFDAPAAQRLAAASEYRPLDCAALR